jgi:hypothetical protein
LTSTRAASTTTAVAGPWRDRVDAVDWDTIARPPGRTMTLSTTISETCPPGEGISTSDGR